jgi:hypothetical protein
MKAIIFHDGWSADDYQTWIEFCMQSPFICGGYIYQAKIFFSFRYTHAPIHLINGADVSNVIPPRRG